MRIPKCSAALLTLCLTQAAWAEGPGLGTPLFQDELPSYASYIMPDGQGLPTGGGTAREGKALYLSSCASCHGETGTEGPIMPPVGPNSVWPKPAGGYWPYATTLFDYIRRAMPFNAPKSLSDDEVYGLVAFILYRNGVIDQDLVMDAQSLPAVKMPNRANFIDVWQKLGETPW